MSDTETLDLGFKVFKFNFQDIVCCYTYGQNIIKVSRSDLSLTTISGTYAVSGDEAGEEDGLLSCCL